MAGSNCASITAAQRARLEHWLNAPPERSVRPAPVRARDPGARLPLSFAQERLWFLAQYDPDSPLYNVPVAVRLSGALDRGAAERALGAIVARHEILRARFSASQGVPAQTIDPPRPVRLETVDLSGVPEDRREGALGLRLAAACRRPFDLARDPLLRATLYRSGPADHTLLLVKHHIVTDGWSENAFLREFAEFYREFSGGPPAAPPPLALQYADYAAAQREAAGGPSWERHLAYWRTKLAGAPPLMELPTDRVRPARLSGRGGCRRIVLPAELVQAVRSVAGKEGATLFMVFCAAFQAFLHRYAGLTDIVVGAPVAGRTRSEIEPLIGFFVNTLPLRAACAGPLPFARLLRQTRETILGALAHQDAPFEKIVEDLRPVRSPSHLPLVQILFVFKGATFRIPQPDGLKLTAAALDTGTAKFDLTLMVDETAEGWAAAFEYASDLFDAATVDRMLESYRTLLEEAVRDPGLPLSRLPLLSAAEERRIVGRLSGTDAGFDTGRLLPELLAEQAQRAPDRTAFVFGDRCLSHREWHLRAERIAERLRARGAGPGTFVAVCADRSPAMAAALLGILLAGAAYVPLDPAYPPDRLRFMIEDADAPILIAQPGRLPEEIAGLPRGSTLWLDADGGIAGEREARGCAAGGARAGPAGPNDPVYLLHTSGSTGRPKGVVATHANLLHFFAGIDPVAGPGPGVWLSLASLCFDPSVLELWWALTRGFSVAVVTEEERRSESLAGRIRRDGVTHLQCTPSLARMLLGLPALRESLRPIRKLLVGGEALPADLARSLSLAVGGEVYNVYGPTETTVWATAHKLEEPAPDGCRKIVPIGRPLANTRAYVLDGQGRTAPIGVPGEIHLGGGGVSAGYFRRPELTAERFLHDPFGAGGGRLYRTGDIGRLLADGTIEFLGRADEQVKVRGHRVELGEIEAVLREHPSVHAAVVLLREDRPDDPRLAAYVVAKPGIRGGPPEWKAHLESRLPSPLVPAAFVVLPGFPLTPTGKVDRRALRPPGPEAGLVSGVRRPPTEPERRLLEVWASVLGVASLEPEDNFFAHGGHSLLAVRLVARMEETLGLRVALSTLYEAPSVALLARRLGFGAARPSGTGHGRARVPELAAIQPRGSRPPLYLVHGIGSGMLWGYANLAARLGTGQPLYAFKSRALDGGEEFPSIEAMAEHYVDALLRFQPDGPYALGGYCFGGNVAHEMAGRLRRLGREVRLLVLLNSYPQNSRFERMRWTPSAIAAFARNFALLAGEFARGEAGNRRRYLLWKLRRLLRALRRPGAADPDALVDLAAFP
ncbi:MAG: non-ribosomal peptide synthetase, partial [Opitutaceae bacterium]